MPPRKSRPPPANQRVQPVAPPPSVPLLHPGLYDSQPSYARLLALAATHPKLISNRWRKKNVALRTKSLERAWAASIDTIALDPFTGPNIHAKDETIGKPPSTIAKAAPKFGQDILEAALVSPADEYPIGKLALENYLYAPVINLENLSQTPAPLLNLLYTRTTLRPSELGLWDYIRAVEPALKLFEAGEEKEMDRESLQVVTIGAEETEYGLIKTWSTRSLDFLRGVTSKTVITLEPKAKYLFKWQKMMTEFCLNCVLDILDTDARKPDAIMALSSKNINKDDLKELIKDVDILPQGNMPTGFHASRAHSLKMQFYSAPPVFDFNHAYQLAITMLRDAEDNVNLLRTDPSYFLHEAEIFIEHRHEHIPDLQGRKGEPHSFESVRDAVLKLIHNSYIHLLIWNEIIILFEDANELVIDGRGVSNETLDEIIYNIQKLLIMLESFLDNILSLHSATGPNLRKYFSRYYTESFVSKLLLVAEAPPCTVYEKDPVAGILMCSAPLVGRWEKKVFTIRRISSEIERELLERPQLKDSIHPWIMGILGYVAGINELMDALELYIPSTINLIDISRFDVNIINSLGRIMQEVDLSSFSGAGNGWQALLKIENSPGALEAFWKILDKKVSELSKDGRTLADVVGASKGRLAKKRKGKWNWQGQIWFADGTGSEEGNQKDLRSSSTDIPELIPVGSYEDSLGYGNDTWIVTEDPVAPPRRRQMPLQAANLEPSRPFGINAEGSHGTTPDVPAAIRQKTKTRGTANEEELTPPAPPPVAPPKPTIFVSSRVHRLLTTLSSAAAPISWDDFVYLMTHLGFKRIPVGGSVFRFVPENPDVNESISFHRPHPEAVLTKKKCNWFWRRLKSNYGWDVDRFSVVNKEAESGTADDHDA